MLKPASIEKFIAILLLLWSFLILYSVFASLQAYVAAGIVRWNDISLTGILAMAHYRILIPLFSTIAALYLLAGKRFGWIACIVMNFVNAVFICISVYSLSTDTALSQSVYINAALIALAFTGMGILLLQRDMRMRYETKPGTHDDSDAKQIS